MPGSVLLIDADPQVQDQVAAACAQLGASLIRVERPAQGFEAIETSPPDVVLLDAEQPEGDGFEAFAHLRERWPRLCTLLIAERARRDQAIEAMKQGAIDYLLKPLKHDDLVSHVENALRISHDRTVPTVYESDDRDTPVERVVGQSAAMHEVFKLIGLIAPRDATVLVTGESGTGKELVARALYHHSQRKDLPFLAVNCAAIPETLLESELFGHEKGAFTGADVRRIGKFEQCNGGTLLLDEIGDLPLTTQAKLLRVLQDGTFQRLGGTETIRCDVRIIAATNQPIERLIAERRFRQDLYYRLKVTSIKLPPLREREVDVVLLAHYFVRRSNPQLGSSVRHFAPEVLPALLSYAWPGNVRELENVVKAALVVARGNVFQLEHLPERIREVERMAPGDSGRHTPGQPVAAKPEGLAEMCRQLLRNTHLHGQVYKQVVEAAEREAIRACLEQTSGQLSQAARVLGITRSTLRKKMTLLGIQVSKSVTSP